MKKFVQTIKDIFSIEELKNRIITTVLFLLVFRIGSFIVLPGIDPAQLEDGFGDIRDFLNTLLGGAFGRGSIFALGIMPYISASIVIQLLTVALPSFQKMREDGEAGNKKITQITRLLTIVITVFQSSAYLATSVSANAIYPEVGQTFFTISAIIILTAGTMFCMWLGERITDKGIGNGISLLIMVGIISRLPQSLIFEAQNKEIFGLGGLFFLFELIILFFIVVLVVMITTAVRRVPVQYAKQVIGNKVYGGERQYLPLKLNAAGVMPIIFAQSMMFVPGLVMNAFPENPTALAMLQPFSDPKFLGYNLLFAVMIILFTFFYTAIQINPQKMAEDMQRSGGYVPGIEPGAATSEYLDNILSKITLPGSIFLAIIAIVPAIAMAFGVNNAFAQFYGGTSLLIMVGVILDTLQQIESYLLIRHYDGLMEDGKIGDEADAFDAAVMEEDFSTTTTTVK